VARFVFPFNVGHKTVRISEMNIGILYTDILMISVLVAQISAEAVMKL
jgi:hypothetical protein